MADHAFKTIGKDVKERKLKSVVLLYGREQYLVDWAVNMLADKFVNPATRELDYSIFDASVSSTDDIIAACETIAMLSEKRVVLVKVGSDKIKINENELAAYLKDVPSETMLMLAFENEEKAKVLFEAAKGCASVYEFGTLDEKTLNGFIGKRLKAEGKNMTAQALRELTTMSGYFNKDSDYTIYNLVNDISKLAAFSETDVISKEEVEEITGQSAEKNIFALIEAVSRGRKDDGFRILNDLLNNGTAIFNILGLLVSQFELMLSGKQLKAQGMNPPQIAKTLKANEFRVKKVMQVADRYSEDDLKRILLSAYEIDSSIKSGQLPDRLALEMFMASM